MRRGGGLPRPITGALLVPLRRGRRPRRPALPRSLCPSVGATLAVARGRGRAPPLCTPRNAPSRADRVVRPCKIMPCRAGPMCPAVPPYPLQKARHCHSQCAHWLWQSVPQSLPCLKGGGPAAGWWRDSCGEESPSHGFAVPAPFRQGGRGDGGCGLPQPVCALASQ